MSQPALRIDIKKKAEKDGIPFYLRMTLEAVEKNGTCTLHDVVKETKRTLAFEAVNLNHLVRSGYLRKQVPEGNKSIPKYSLL